jgi:hypothetical protein
LDIRSAQNWMHNSREKYNHDPETLVEKERSVKAFLEWLGVDENYAGDVLYILFNGVLPWKFVVSLLRRLDRKYF